jgi:hypothetical protein
MQGKEGKKIGELDSGVLAVLVNNTFYQAHLDILYLISVNPEVIFCVIWSAV